MKEKFLQNFESIFDEIQPGQISLDLRLEELNDWNSLSALSLIAMADEIYQVNLTGEEVRSFETVQDVFNTIINKQNGNA